MSENERAILLGMFASIREQATAAMRMLTDGARAMPQQQDTERPAYFGDEEQENQA